MRPSVRVPAGAGMVVRLGVSPGAAAAIEAAEPSSTLVAAALHASTRRPLVVSVERAGAVLGVLALERHELWQWDALPLIVDDGCTELLARLVHWSPASAVVGVGVHVQPLIAHLPRYRSAGHGPFFAAPADLLPAVEDLDPRARQATMADGPALADLFAGSYRLGRPTTRGSWQRFVDRTLTDGLAVVAEVDGRVVGGLLCASVSERWAFGTEAVVDGGHRGLGLSWAMANRMFALVRSLELRMCGAKVDDNPMDADRHFADHGALDGELWGVGLDPHVGWPSVGWRRRQLRRLRRHARRWVPSSFVTRARSALGRRRW